MTYSTASSLKSNDFPVSMKSQIEAAIKTISPDDPSSLTAADQRLGLSTLDTVHGTLDRNLTMMSQILEALPHTHCDMSKVITLPVQATLPLAKQTVT